MKEKLPWYQSDDQKWMVWITNGVAIPILENEENEVMRYPESGNEILFTNCTLEQAYHICSGYNVNAEWDK